VCSATVTTERFGAFGMFGPPIRIHDLLKRRFQCHTVYRWQSAVESQHSIGSFREPDATLRVLTFRHITTMLCGEPELTNHVSKFFGCGSARFFEEIDRAGRVDHGYQRQRVFGRDMTPGQ
jgi:hypothetical protein